MLKRMVEIFVFVLGMHAAACPQDKGFGLGILIGEPTGVSGKAWISHRNAIDAGVAWSFRHKGFIHLHADHLWHFPDIIQSSEQFTLYTGIGGRLGVGRGDGVFGVRIAGGLALWPSHAPIEIFLELAPILDLVPATELSANGGIGVRFFFR